MVAKDVETASEVQIPVQSLQCHFINYFKKRKKNIFYCAHSHRNIDFKISDLHFMIYFFK